MPNLVEILVTAKNLAGPALAAVDAQVNRSNASLKVLHKTAGIAALGFAAFGVEAVKSASKFDSEMSLLQTQAGVSGDKIDGLKQGVLNLAGKVGQDPDSLAEALYHVESNFESMGISSSKALKLTETAAKGATIGHANLVDVTNALTAAVAAQIPGVQNLDQAMGVLNATVGVGDMKMQDLASAFGSGMLATVKGFGLSISDVGAALAVFGDNNIRGALAGNQLRMSVMALAKPVSSGASALKSIGLQTDTLAKDMQRGGLKLALEDLVAHMTAAGITSQQQGQIITDAFGRKAGSGLNILVGQMDRLESKYPALEAGANNFSKSWDETRKTFAFQMKQLQTGFEALGITIGEKLIPPVQATVSLLARHRTATTDATVAMLGLAAATVAVSAAMKVAAGVKILWSGITAGASVATSAFESLALRSMYMRDAFLAAGGGVKGLGSAFGALSTGAKVGVALVAIGGLALAIAKLYSSSKQSRVSIDDLSRSIEDGLGRSAGISSPVIDNLRKAMQGMVKETDDSASAWDKFSYSFTHWGAKFSSSASSAKAAANDYKDLGKALGQIAQDKGVDTATNALELLRREGIKVPTKYLKDYNAALADAKVQSDITAASQGRFGQQAQQVQKALQAQQAAADGLSQSLQALDKVNQDAFDAQTKMEDAISASTQALKENGRTLSLHTDAGRKNRDALSAIASATDTYTAALSKQGATMGDIDTAYKRGYDSLVKAAQGFGLSETAARKLADQLLHVPKEVKVQGNIDDLEAKLRKAKSDLEHAPKSQRARLLGDIADLEAKIRKARAELNNIDGYTATTYINIVTTHNADGSVTAHEGGGYAHGGVIGAASGGPRSRLTLVGEHGPELVSLAPGSTVHSNPDTRRMLSGASGGAAGAVYQVNLNVDGRTLARVLLDPQRELIRQLGGDVQTVMGARI
ncbi:MAG: phage tail tape measure protein [Streptomyces sp.]|nr:phage tail tape measure protein [Streptomyces sp.]